LLLLLPEGLLIPAAPCCCWLLPLDWPEAEGAAVPPEVVVEPETEDEADWVPEEDEPLEDVDPPTCVLPLAGEFVVVGVVSEIVISK
jgi:hypothetical protein